jgi:hypothetical protein
MVSRLRRRAGGNRVSGAAQHEIASSYFSMTILWVSVPLTLLTL